MFQRKQNGCCCFVFFQSRIKPNVKTVRVLYVEGPPIRLSCIKPHKQSIVWGGVVDRSRSLFRDRGSFSSSRQIVDDRRRRLTSKCNQQRPAAPNPAFLFFFFFFSLICSKSKEEEMMMTVFDFAQTCGRRALEIRSGVCSGCSR